MSDERTREELVARLYAALRHEKSCVCGECSGGLNTVDELARRLEAYEKAAESPMGPGYISPVQKVVQLQAELAEAREALADAATDVARAYNRLVAALGMDEGDET